MPGEIQVFVSYAREDNVSPFEAPLQGFVTFLHDQLDRELNGLGSPAVKLWRDTRNIVRIEQFDLLLEAEITKSSILLVILSPNWICDPTCLKELEWFGECWSGERELKVEERVFVALVRSVETSIRPTVLQGRQGITFYSEDNLGGVVSARSYFSRGRVQDNRYYENIQELADYLHRAATRTTCAKAT
jgi:hypothetical protein